MYNLLPPSASDVLSAFREAQSKGLSPRSILDFEWKNIREGNNNTKWVSIFVTVDGNRYPFRMVYKEEKHSGRIKPNTEEEAIKINQLNPKLAAIGKRTTEACLQITKYNVPVPCQEDGITIQLDDDGNEMWPDDSHKSTLFAVLEYVGECFQEEIKDMVQKKMIVDRITNDLPRRYIRTKTTVPTSIIQNRISESAHKNGGRLMLNPIARIKIRFDKDGQPEANFLDITKPCLTERNAKHFEPLRDETGEKLNINNVHRMILPHTYHTGVVSLSAICFSSMGISIPMSVDLYNIVKPAPVTRLDLEELFKGCSLFDEFEVRNAPPGPSSQDTEDESQDEEDPFAEYTNSLS